MADRPRMILLKPKVHTYLSYISSTISTGDTVVRQPDLPYLRILGGAQTSMTMWGYEIPPHTLPFIVRRVIATFASSFSFHPVTDTLETTSELLSVA